MISKLAVIFKITINIKLEKYIFIGHTFDLIKTQEDILYRLKNGKHENNRLQNKFNELMETDPKHLVLDFKFETLQALRPDYYPNNILPLVMEQLETSFIETIREDLKIKSKENLLLNT